MDYKLIRSKISSKKCFCRGCRYYRVKKDSEMSFSLILQTYLDNGYGTCVNPYEEKVVFINTGKKLKTIVTCRLPDETVNRIF